MSKSKRKIIRPTYVAKAERKKTQKKTPMPKGLRYGLLFCGAALVLAVALFLIFYTPDYLSIEDGVVQKEPNWVVANLSQNNTKRYYKLGEAEAIDGFTMEENASDTAVWFYPDEEGARIRNYCVTGVNDTPANMMEKTYATFQAVYGEENISDPMVATIAGRNCEYFISEAEGEAEEGVRRSQMLCLYMPAARDAGILMNVFINVTEEMPAMTNGELVDLAEEIADRITFEE